MSFKEQTPLLGYATTGLLISELKARYECHGPKAGHEAMKTMLDFIQDCFATLPHGGLAYRPVDGTE